MKASLPQSAFLLTTLSPAPLQPDGGPERSVPPLIAKEPETAQVRQANDQLPVGCRVAIDGDVAPAGRRRGDWLCADQLGNLGRDHGLAQAQEQSGR